MRTPLLSLAFLLAAAPAPVGADVPPYQPPDPSGREPDPVLPLPLYVTRPDEDGLYLRGGWNLGPWPGAWLGVGWLFPDGSTLGIGWRRQAGRVEMICRRGVREDECFRCSFVTGTRPGVSSEWYIGYGCAGEVDLGATLLPDVSLLRSRAGITWYPAELVNLTIGYDLFRGLDCGWEARF